jgi:hypothetical protein
MRLALFASALLLGLALPVRADPENERWCGETPDGKIRWCINIRAPWECGGTTGEGWHCDDDACWCGPANALENPAPNNTGLPLVAREAAQHGVTCTVTQHSGLVIGDCGYSGWVCRPDWCQDSEQRAWSPVPAPKRRV